MQDSLGADLDGFYPRKPFEMNGVAEAAYVIAVLQLIGAVVDFVLEPAIAAAVIIFKLQIRTSQSKTMAMFDLYCGSPSE